MMLLSFALYTMLEAHFVSVFMGRNYALFLMGAYWGGIVDPKGKGAVKGWLWSLPGMLPAALRPTDRAGRNVRHFSGESL